MRDEQVVTEESGSVSVCVESGVTDGFETALIVSLTVQDGTACKPQISQISRSTPPFTSIPEDVFIPHPFQVVFYEGQNNSTSCIDIFLLPDSVLEDDEYFTISIATAGTEPHARILSPSVVTFTIQDTIPSVTLLYNTRRQSGFESSVVHHCSRWFLYCGWDHKLYYNCTA